MIRVSEYIGDDVETILNNREKYEQIIKDLGFTKKYENSNFEKEIEMGPGTDKDGKEYTDGQKSFLCRRVKTNYSNLRP